MVPVAERVSVAAALGARAGTRCPTGDPLDDALDIPNEETSYPPRPHLLLVGPNAGPTLAKMPRDMRLPQCRAEGGPAPPLVVDAVRWEKVPLPTPAVALRPIGPPVAPRPPPAQAPCDAHLPLSPDPCDDLACCEQVVATASPDISPISTVLTEGAPSDLLAVSPATDRAQLPYRHAVMSASALMSAALAAERAVPVEEVDGTVASAPGSPPVVGRRAVRVPDEAAAQGHLRRSWPGAATCAGWTGASSSSVAWRGGLMPVSVPALKRDAVAFALAGLVGMAPQWPSGGADRGPTPGKKAQEAEAGLLEVPTICAFLRSHFADVDVSNKRLVTESDLVNFVIARTCQRHGADVDADLRGLLQETARRTYRQVALRCEGIRAEDWIHFGLMLASDASHLDRSLLNRQLCKELHLRQGLLRDILHAFEGCDRRGAGVLRSADVEESAIGGSEVVKDMHTLVDGQISYYEFVAYCLGYRAMPVILHWYDVSNGYAQWVPKGVLGGQSLQGIWHTGVVVFGKEYWYGGKVLSSVPGTAPFPPGPVRSTDLGWTLRTREELEDFLRMEAAPKYTRDSYDVLRHNCNHFSDEVAAFLIRGGRIPDEAKSQPEAILGAPLLEAVRPYLNHWLSGFEAEGCDAAIDDLMAEWRARLWPGDLALLMPEESLRLNEPVRLVRVSNVDSWGGLCDVTYFEPGAAGDRGVAAMAAARGHKGNTRILRLGACIRSGCFWDWRVVCVQGVPLPALRPHALGGRDAQPAGSSIRACLRASYPDLQRHLRRRANISAHCPRGHGMRPGGKSQGPFGLARGLPASSCGVCGTPIPKGDPRLECGSCAFSLCASCDRKGVCQGHFSLGAIDTDMAKVLLEDTNWVRYKARRYMAAAGAAGASVGLAAWQQKVAARVYGDLGHPLPSAEGIIEIFRRHGEGETGSLNEDGFCDLLLELLAMNAGVVSL